MALYLVRHGETDWNREKRFQSRTDVPLNETGLAQAQAMHLEFQKRHLDFDLALSSPLSRAKDTAKIILQGSDTPLYIEPLFIELDFGEMEGILESELKTRYGEEFARWRESQYTTPSPGGGEDIVAGARRVYPAVERLRKQAINGDVLIVAHQAVNMAIKVAISGMSNLEIAATFRQANDQVDIWDLAKVQRIEQFRVSIG